MKKTVTENGILYALDEEKLVPDKNWTDIKNYIVYTMINGTETISGSAYMKSMVINGCRVKVTYAKVSDTYKISDAWIRI